MTTLQLNKDELIKKLNLSSLDKAYVIYSPINYDLGVKIVDSTADIENNFNWLQAFYYTQEDLNRDLPFLEEKMSEEGILWISWPKKSAKLNGDLSDNAVRSIGLACGLVDTKVAAVNKTWSALKFVYRKKDRL